MPFTSFARDAAVKHRRKCEEERPALTQLPFEGSMIAVIEGMFREGLGHHTLTPGSDPAVLGATAAWAVFGAARSWFLNPKRVSAEVMAAKIEALVTPICLASS